MPERKNLRPARIAGLAVLSLLLVVCALPLPGLTPTPVKTRVPPTATPPPPTETLQPFPSPLPSISLDPNQRPLVWFAPLPPLPRSQWREYTGAEDFMSLFTPDAAWGAAARSIQVFQLPGEWVSSVATEPELSQVVTELNRRGLALAVETGPLNPSAACGQGLEGFDGVEEGRKIANRIKSVGGVINFLVLDKPYYYGHFYIGPLGCAWDTSRVASEVGQYIQAVKLAFPDVIVGDAEVLTGEAYATDYQTWLDTFKQVNGYNLGFLHLDVNWIRVGWAEQVKSVEDYGRQIGVPVGIIYGGDAAQKSDADWLTLAGERVRKYELQAGGKPEHVIFQSRNDKPDFLLPETNPNTFSAFLDAYAKDKAGLGYQREGPGANLALGKKVKFSGQVTTQPADLAVDADPATYWSSPRGPVEWIEVDLGAPTTIRAITLLVSQFPAGKTVHKIIVKGPGNNNTYTAVYTFTGVTTDAQTLTFTPAAPLKGIQFVRIQTLISPAWVAWREIGIIAGP